MKALTVCPGHLAEGFDRYCPSCTRRLFDGKRVSPCLDFNYDADNADMAENINQLSVSGVQEKLSAVIDNGRIVLTPVGEKDTILSNRHRYTNTCASAIRFRPTST